MNVPGRATMWRLFLAFSVAWLLVTMIVGPARADDLPDGVVITSSTRLVAGSAHQPFAVTVWNIGDEAITDFTLWYPLRGSVKIVAVKASQGTYADAMWRVGDLRPGDRAWLRINAKRSLR